MHNTGFFVRCVGMLTSSTSEGLVWPILQIMSAGAVGVRGRYGDVDQSSLRNL